MATRIVKTGEPKDLLNYLNSFPNDPFSYVIDPNDSRQVIIENQKIFKSTNQEFSVGAVFKLLSADNKLFFCKVIAKSLWNPELFIVEGSQVHTVKDSIWDFNPKDKVARPKPKSGINYEKLESIASNIITVISDAEPQDQGSKPTRNSPDDGMPAPPPTRNSDGTRTPDPTRNSPDGYRSSDFSPSNHPLTEYWLNRAKAHNSSHLNVPIVAIMDTGIDFRYDWTMSHESIIGDKPPFTSELMPNCPLWFNESLTPTYLKPDLNTPCQEILQRDYIGWNFVGEGRLASNQHPNPYDDDASCKHGTRIAAIIAQQTDWNVRLMILKTHDYRGVGPLFTIFCAFDYLLQRTVENSEIKMVNASWGYYGSENAEFRNYITKLKDKGIWFVNAAGNQTDFSDDYHGHELLIGGETERYPACFSTSLDNVVTVTTAKHRLRLKMLPPTQSINFNLQTVENYSHTYVSVAIGAGHDGRFPEPLAPTKDTIKGSSYATAYFTGRLARHLFEWGIGDINRLCHSISSSPSSVLPNRISNGNFLMVDMDYLEESY